MNKILTVLTLFLLLFGMAVGVQAVPIFVGSFDKDLTPYSAPPLDALGNPYIDTADNLNVLINSYNADNDPDLPNVVEPYVEKAAPGDFPDDWTTGTIDLSPGYAYLSLKYSGYVDLWYVFGETSFPFSVQQGLSHYRLWNPVSVPEPSTMLLLGTGLIGLVSLSRQKMKK